MEGSLQRRKEMITVYLLLQLRIIDEFLTKTFDILVLLNDHSYDSAVPIFCI